MTAPSTAPVLSTPDAHIFQEPQSTQAQAHAPPLSDDDFAEAYEIDRTVKEIVAGRWHRIALQFPDDMLRDAPRVVETLHKHLAQSDGPVANGGTPLQPGSDAISVNLAGLRVDENTLLSTTSQDPIKLTILADTSYGACCVDEIAAEHADAEVVVHYGRTCLSPTARLPVIYVYTLRPLDLDGVCSAFEQVLPDHQTKVILLADLPYQGHVPGLESKLRSVGYSNISASSIIHDPASLIPNRTLPTEVEANPSGLRDYSVFHISEPPDSLLLTISSRVNSIYIYPMQNAGTAPAAPIQASTAQALRRRYALVTRLSTEPIFGILINTLSVKHYMDVLGHVKDMISAAGKKYYTFVVGKVNAAKVANFSEVGGWVVIGCWESSLIESADFWKPIITPFELKLALTDEKDRLWTGEWNSSFQAVLSSVSLSPTTNDAALDHRSRTADDVPVAAGEDAHEDDESDSEPPVFDLRTGRYVSHTRPMAPARRPTAHDSASAASGQASATTTTPTSLVKRATGGQVARVGDAVSPAAEYLRSQRTWRGLGSEVEVAYQLDPEGAQVEEGRSGVARGYIVGDDDEGRS